MVESIHPMAKGAEAYRTIFKKALISGSWPVAKALLNVQRKLLEPPQTASQSLEYFNFVDKVSPELYRLAQVVISEGTFALAELYTSQEPYYRIIAQTQGWASHVVFSLLSTDQFDEMNWSRIDVRKLKSIRVAHETFRFTTVCNKKHIDGLFIESEDLSLRRPKNVSHLWTPIRLVVARA